MSHQRSLKWFVLLAVLSLLLAPVSALGETVSVTSTNPAAIVQWNQIALRAAITVDKQPATHAMISVGFVQAAVYDAVVAIEGGYQPYKLHLGKHRGASVDAAVAAAAHDVLVHYFPAQQAALDADYTAALAAIPAGPAKSEGLAVGQAAAAGMIQMRQGDGYGVDIGFTMPAPAPGVWQLSAGESPMTPWASQVRPFLLRNPDQFRPGPPPALTSRKWAIDYAEVQTMGRSDSTVRTAEQTDVARFWSMQPTLQYNTAFAYLVSTRGLNAVQAARLYAMGNLVGADAGIACMDAKYHYLFWRPKFSIPQGDTDGNPATVGDPTWTPLLATPTHSEYPSGHGCLTSAMAEVFAVFFGTEKINLDLTSTVPNLLHPTRHYDRVEDLTREIIDARVWSGLHYRNSDVTGVKLGSNVAHWTLERYFEREGD